MTNQKFGKKEKLKSKKDIGILFSEGKSISQYPLKLIYTQSFSSKNNATSVSVSKRNFKKAVDRNLIKRLLRESYRKNKYLVLDNTTHHFNFMFLFIGKEILDSKYIEAKMKKILQKFIEKETTTS